MPVIVRRPVGEGRERDERRRELAAGGQVEVDAADAAPPPVTVSGRRRGVDGRAEAGQQVGQVRADLRGVRPASR